MYPFFTYSPGRHYFEYKWYNLELLRLIGSAPYGGCDAAEFLELVASLKPNDADEWHHKFLALAERTQAKGEQMSEAGHEAVARGAYLRASNYFRCAQYMFPIMPAARQGEFLKLYHRSIRSFEQAAELMEHRVERVSIPFQPPEYRAPAVELPGWLHLPAAHQRLSGRKTPLLICVGGADSTQEELYFLSAAEGPGLGYAILTFDGPGQGLTLRESGVPLRPDGEVVIEAVLDFIESYAAEHPEADLDVDAISITGQSLGGYLALRGAADPRIKACVAVDPIYDFYDLAMSRMPRWFMWPWERNYMGDGFVDFAVIEHSKLDVATKYTFAQGGQMFGSASPAQMIRDMKQYTFRLDKTITASKRHGNNRDYLEWVTCPVFVTGAAGDEKLFLPEMSTSAIMRNLANVPDEHKELWIPKEWSEGGAQAKSGAWPLLQHRCFKFLDEKLGISRGAKPVQLKTGFVKGVNGHGLTNGGLNGALNGATNGITNGVH
uniref:Alpha/beta hydrolase ucsC n=1 Tax=Acremonium sp. TaxID=2046025 RepID=UCSC_ACRSP|nr:RecName: Full=Alpha/beta hydrolase ucsC; AltName: Full=UCS1025A pyrrolizidinone biosynthesis cluster protein C [Acremonium sp.]QBC88147.1 UcsC [Acremonium sp.]